MNQSRKETFALQGESAAAREEGGGGGGGQGDEAERKRGDGQGDDDEKQYSMRKSTHQFAQLLLALLHWVRLSLGLVSTTPPPKHTYSGPPSLCTRFPCHVAPSSLPSAPSSFIPFFTSMLRLSYPLRPSLPPSLAARLFPYGIGSKLTPSLPPPSHLLVELMMDSTSSE